MLLRDLLDPRPHPAQNFSFLLCLGDGKHEHMTKVHKPQAPQMGRLARQSHSWSSKAQSDIRSGPWRATCARSWNQILRPDSKYVLIRRFLELQLTRRLQERTRNKMKDYLVMGPALQVTHILAFALAQKAPTLKIIRLPSGPTLSFRIERYSLMKDVLNSKKRKRSIGMEYLTPPLVSHYPFCLHHD